MHRSHTVACVGQASLLLHLQHHSGPVHHVSLLASPSAPGSEVFRMVVCTADQLIWRELEWLDGIWRSSRVALGAGSFGSRLINLEKLSKSWFFYLYIIYSQSITTFSQVQGRLHHSAQMCTPASLPWFQTGRFLCRYTAGHFLRSV